MKKNNVLKMVLLLVLVSLSAGCSFQSAPGPTKTLDWGPFLTEAVLTVWAKNTALAQQNPVEPSVTPSPSNTLEPSATATPTDTQTPFPTISSHTPSATSTPSPLTNTPGSQGGQSSATPGGTSCDRAQLVKDVTVEDNSPFTPGATFTKIWSLKNVGTCTWTTSYRIVFVSGSNIGTSQSVTMPKSVAPNQTVDISVPMKAPDKVGTYRGDWMISNASGSRFGVGSNANTSIWAKIRVVDLANPGLVYNFASNFCKADWQSASGSLPCSGRSDAAEGFAKLLDAPKLETRPEDELGLWVHPNNAGTGWISGMYPEFDVQQGHRFIAWVGCEGDSKGCNVTFRLDYRNQSGSVKNLASWQEVLDGQVTKVNLDLASLAGQHVRFILRVDVRGGDPAKANAIWFVPGIILSAQPTATSTPQPSTATSTPTPTSTPENTSTPTDTSTPTATSTETPISYP